MPTKYEFRVCDTMRKFFLTEKITNTNIVKKSPIGDFQSEDKLDLYALEKKL